MSTAVATHHSSAGGLSHLVEAATALTALVESVGTSTSSKGQTKSVVSDDDECVNKLNAPKPSKKRDIFPQKLMDILADSSFSDVVSWLPHGRSFVIIRPDIFTEKVLPKYLPPVDARASTKYPSFTRKLNRWGFRQATRGPDTGAFHHPLFRKDNPEMCTQMVCQKSRERQSVPRRALPPKKRSVAAQSSCDLPNTGRALSESGQAASVSADDRSVVSFANSVSGAQSRDSTTVHPPVSFVSGDKEASKLPFISNDEAFVTRTLKERNTQEVIKVAKVMLYEAFMSAMKDDRS